MALRGWFFENAAHIVYTNLKTRDTLDLNAEKKALVDFPTHAFVSIL